MSRCKFCYEEGCIRCEDDLFNGNGIPLERIRKGDEIRKKLEMETTTYRCKLCPACNEYRNECIFNECMFYKNNSICQACEEWIIWITPFCEKCDTWSKCCKNKYCPCDNHEEYECNFCQMNYDKEVEKLIRNRVESGNNDNLS